MKYENKIAKKQLGQNFLVDENKIKEIVNSIGLDGTQEVLEIGPGLGAITIGLAEKTKKLKLIEIDDEAIKILQEKISLYSNVELIKGDILKINLSEMFEKDFFFISNLPYYIASKILFSAISEKKIIKISVMMQKEMGERLTSNFNNKQFGRFSVAVRSFFDIKEVISVPRKCFLPSPNVDSVFINMERKNNDIKNIDNYLDFVKGCFANKRKTLLNSLKNFNFEKKEKVKEYLIINNLNLNIRAEQIDVEEYIKIWNFIK